MWAKADCNRSCGERPWLCSSGMKDLEGRAGWGGCPGLGGRAEAGGRVGDAGGERGRGKGGTQPQIRGMRPSLGSSPRTWPR